MSGNVVRVLLKVIGTTAYQIPDFVLTLKCFFIYSDVVGVLLVFPQQLQLLYSQWSIKVKKNTLMLLTHDPIILSLNDTIYMKTIREQDQGLKSTRVHNNPCLYM